MFSFLASLSVITPLEVERMAIPKGRLIDYTTTAGQVAERLDRPDINITEE